MSAKFRKVWSPFDPVRCLNRLIGELRAKSGAVWEFHKISKLGSVEGSSYSLIPDNFHGRTKSIRGPETLRLVIFTKPGLLSSYDPNMRFSLGASENSYSWFVGEIF